MKRAASPLPYELPQPHASSSREAASPRKAVRASAAAHDTKTAKRRRSTSPQPLAEVDYNTTNGSATLAHAVPSKKRVRSRSPPEEQEPTTELFPDDAEDEGVAFSEDQGQSTAARDDETVIPETSTEPIRAGELGHLSAATSETSPELQGGPPDFSVRQAGTVNIDGEGEDDGEEEQEVEGYDGMEESHEAGDEDEDIPLAQSVAAKREVATQVVEAEPSYGGEQPLFINGDGYDEEDDEEEAAGPSSGSYHSGDSALYDMDHRPLLERTAIKKDLKDFTSEFHALGQEGRYMPVDRLGEGTFSSVYLAHDLLHDEHDNSYWYQPSAGTISARRPEGGRVKVALKKILATSSPARIENELRILEGLRGSEFVTQLITAFREEDQVIVVLPFHDSDDFRHFYKHMDIVHIRSYMFSMLFGLHEIHRRGIVHRDIKPANFLYDYERQTGVICDFGLAERYHPPRKAKCQHAPATLEHLHGTKAKTSETSRVEQAHYDASKRSRAGEGKVGFPVDDKRQAIRTNRAGTRGFRAPEVLLKCPDQTVAIDVWSAGVILLGILSQKFPVFNSNDDTEALMELATLFGKSAMERCALLHNRTIISNLPGLEAPIPVLKNVILRLNPELYTPSEPDVTPDQARRHIEGVDKAISLCGELLSLDATKRPTARTLLMHKFFHGPEIRELYWDSHEEEWHDLSGPLDIIDPTLGKCGSLHDFNEKGMHVATFEDVEWEMQFGQGYPLRENDWCPDHKHWQERFGECPLATSTRYREPDYEGDA